MKRLAATFAASFAALALLSGLGGCVLNHKQPTLPLPADHTAIRVEFLPSLDDAWTWRSDQMDQMIVLLKAMHAFGPSFAVATDGVANYTVRMWYSDDHCTQGVARWFPGATTVEVDPSCARGYTELRAATGHDLLHAMGLHHICFSAEDVAGSCMRDGHYSPAMMNPDVSYGDILNAGEGDPNGVAVDEPSYLDILEFRRTRPAVSSGGP